MSNFFITIGVINKKMFLMLIYIILNIFVNIYNHNIEYNEVYLFIDGFSYSLGEVSIFFIAQIFKYRRVSTKVKKHMKNYIKDYSILFIIAILYMFMRVLIPFYLLKSDEDDEDKDKYMDLFLVDSLEIVGLTLITHFFLKYKYYIHHIISVIILVIISIIIDLLLGNYSHIITSLVISSLTFVFANSFLYAYYKYMIEQKYYYFMDVLIISGAMDLSLYILCFIIILIVQNIDGTNKLIFQFYDYYKKYGTRQMIFIFLVGFIPRGMILFLLEVHILDSIGIIFLFISYQIGKIPTTIMSIEGFNRWIVLVLSLFQIFFFLFYLEILEYNFWSLNKNTKRSIIKREIRQSIVDDDGDNEIEIKGYDISDNLENLNEMKEVFNDIDNDD